MQILEIRDLVTDEPGKQLTLTWSPGQESGLKTKELLFCISSSMPCFRHGKNTSTYCKRVSVKLVEFVIMYFVGVLTALVARIIFCGFSQNLEKNVDCHKIAKLESAARKCPMLSDHLLSWTLAICC